MIDRFGEEIEWDLHREVGLDLLDWFRGRHPWGKLTRLISQLPAHGRYKAAVADDEQYADALYAAVGDSGPSSMTMDGWTPERSLLTALVDAVRQLTAITVAANSKDGKVPDVQPLPRPVTGLERAEERRRDQRREAFLQRITRAPE